MRDQQNALGMPNPSQQSSAGTFHEKTIPLRMGMLGMSIDEIPAGAWGFAKLPIGPRDPTMWGGREWVRIKVRAMEEVRANRDIIVANDQGEIKEHTPVELSYEKATGGYQRVGQSYPLPITMGSKAITHYTKLCTAAGNTELIAAPASGQKIRVHYFSYSNKEAATTADVAMRFTSTGDLRHRAIIAPAGGNITVNLTDACWEGTDSQPLNAYLSASYTTGIVFNIGYTIEDVP